jgi:NADH:ubiquinone oxidoreductase subunit 6 (subunit J)
MTDHDLHIAQFYVLAVITALCAVGVVLTQNIVRAAAWLLFTLGGVAGIFFVLGADFVGATQLIVYVGGTLVLVVFGVMLTAQGPLLALKTTAVEWAGALVAGLLLFAVLMVSLWTSGPEWPDGAKASLVRKADTARLPRPLVMREDPASSRNTVELGTALLGQRTGKERVGYLLPFEIVSVHLLVVLIGAAYLARAKRRQGVSRHA